MKFAKILQNKAKYISRSILAFTLKSEISRENERQTVVTMFLLDCQGAVLLVCLG